MTSPIDTTAAMPAPPGGVRLNVWHETSYHYREPVEIAHHLAYLRPLDDVAQRVEQFELSIDPPPAHRREQLDAWLNHRCFFAHAAAHQHLTVRASSVVTLQPGTSGTMPPDSLPWEQVAARLGYASGARFEGACEFSVPSPMIGRHVGLRDLAMSVMAPGMPIAHAAVALMHHIHASFEYATGSTGVETPLTYVLSQHRGVCQDFAHVMIGALRMLGLSAKYVSGYLLTHPPPGQVKMVGADASHAWVAVWCPRRDGEAVWLELDPTNDVIPSVGHVRLATGRDFSDVTPLRGIIRGGSGHTLDVRVHTEAVNP